MIILTAVSFALCLSPAHAKKKTVAVLDFKVNSNALIIGPKLSDYTTREKETNLLTADLITALVKDPTFDVVERSQLDALQKEGQLRTSSVFDLSGKGKAVGADYIVMGNIELIEAQKTRKQFKSSGIEMKAFVARYIVNLRIVDVRTAKIIYADKVTQESTMRYTNESQFSPLKFMNEAKERTVYQLVNVISESISPMKIAKVDGAYAYINRGEGSRLKRGMELRVYLPNSTVTDPDTGEEIGHSEYKIADLRVVEVFPKMTKAQIVRYTMPIEPGAICRVSFESYDSEAHVRPIPAPSSEELVDWN